MRVPRGATRGRTEDIGWQSPQVGSRGTAWVCSPAAAPGTGRSRVPTNLTKGKGRAGQAELTAPDSLRRLAWRRQRVLRKGHGKVIPTRGPRHLQGRPLL